MKNVRFFVAALACLGVFLALAWVAHEQRLLTLDIAAQGVVRSFDSRPLERLMQGMSFLGSGYALVPMNVLVFLLLRRPQPSMAVAVPALTAGATVLGALTKWLVARPRPSAAAYGFPSGHVFTSVAFFGALMYVLWVPDDRSLWRWAGSGFCAMAILGISLSRLYLNSHWLTDDLGGLAGGTSYLLFALAIVGDRLRAAKAPPSPDRTGNP